MIVVKRTQADIDALESVTIDPLQMADDGVDYRSVRVQKPWGHEVEKYRDEKCSVWWLHLHTDQQTSMHAHPNKTTILTIVGGRALLSTLNEQHELSAGDVVVIERGAFHRTASVNGPLVLYETEMPPNKRDLVRLHDSYGRGQGYERV